MQLSRDKQRRSFKRNHTHSNRKARLPHLRQCWLICYRRAMYHSPHFENILLLPPLSLLLANCCKPALSSDTVGLSISTYISIREHRKHNSFISKHKNIKLKPKTELSFWCLLKIWVSAEVAHLQAKIRYKTRQGSLHCFQ